MIILINEWMYTWMDYWMYGPRNKCMKVCMDERRNEWMNGFENEWIQLGTGELMNELMDGWMNKWKSRKEWRKKGRKGRSKETCYVVNVFFFLIYSQNGELCILGMGVGMHPNKWYKTELSPGRTDKSHLYSSLQSYGCVFSRKDFRENEQKNKFRYPRPLVYPTEALLGWWNMSLWCRSHF